MDHTMLTERKRKIYDAFLFSFEIDILWLRFAELDPWVDHFILCEAGETFSGLKKDMVWSKIKGHPSFLPFADKVIYVPLSGFPLGMDDPWKREAYQRNALYRGIPDATDGAVVLISDVDEIPNLREPATRAALEGMQDGDWLRFVQELYNYTPHWRHVRPWHGTAALTKQYIFMSDPSTIQHTRITQPWSKLIDPGGWSFTYFGGVDEVQRKVASYSHTEVNRPEYTNDAHVLESIEKGLPLVRGDGNEYRYVKHPVGLPDVMYQYPEVFGL